MCMVCHFCTAPACLARQECLNSQANEAITVHMEPFAARSSTFLHCILLQNLIRGRGVFCRSLMKSQLASPSFTPTYACLVAIINTKFPEIGELLLKRMISQVGSLPPYSRLAQGLPSNDTKHHAIMPKLQSHNRSCLAARPLSLLIKLAARDTSVC